MCVLSRLTLYDIKAEHLSVSGTHRDVYVVAHLFSTTLGGRYH